MTWIVVGTYLFIGLCWLGYTMGAWGAAEEAQGRAARFDQGDWGAGVVGLIWLFWPVWVVYFFVRLRMARRAEEIRVMKECG